jgi:hypothetical protein
MHTSIHMYTYIYQMNVNYHFFLKLCCFVKSVALIMLPSNIAALGSIGWTEVNVGRDFFVSRLKAKNIIYTQ